MTGVVMAGGKSRRMGRNKSEIVLGRVTLLERVVSRMQALFSRVLISVSPANPASLAGIESVTDIIPGYGSLMGIYSSLKHAQEPVFVTACDMPFINKDLVRHMVEISPGWDVVIPVASGMCEPLHAIYTPACLPFMEEAIEKRDQRIISFFDKVKVLWVRDEVLDRFDPERLSFFNINSENDLLRAETLFEKGY